MQLITGRTPDGGIEYPAYIQTNQRVLTDVHHRVQINDSGQSRARLSYNNQLKTLLTPFIMNGLRFVIRSYYERDCGGAPVAVHMQQFLEYQHVRGVRADQFNRIDRTLEHVIRVYSSPSEQIAEQVGTGLDNFHISDETDKAISQYTGQTCRVYTTGWDIIICTSGVNNETVYAAIGAMTDLLIDTAPDGYFTVPIPVDLYQALGNKDGNAIDEILMGWIDQYFNLEAERARRRAEQMIKVEKDLPHLITRRYDTQLETARRNQADYEKEFLKYIKQVTDLERARFVAMNSNQGFNEVINFIKGCKSIIDMRPSGNGVDWVITFFARANFDIPATKEYLKRPGAWPNRNGMGPVMKAVCDERFVLYFYQPMIVSLAGETINYGLPVAEHNNYTYGSYGIFNPHLSGETGVHCYGSHGPYISKAFAEGQYIEGLSVLIQCTTNMNAHDMTVVERFMDIVAGTGGRRGNSTNRQCLYEPETKRWYTFQEALALLNKEKETQPNA